VYTWRLTLGGSTSKWEYILRLWIASYRHSNHICYNPHIVIKDIFKNKSKLLIFIIVPILIVVGAVVFKYIKTQRVSATEFVGKIEKIEGDIIYATGLFIVPDRNDLLSKDNQRQAQLIVDSNTKFEKFLVFIPSEKELQKTGGYFDGSKLKREQRSSNLDIIKNDLETRDFVITARADRNIYKKSKFIVSDIKYEVQYLQEFDQKK